MSGVSLVGILGRLEAEGKVTPTALDLDPGLPFENFLSLGACLGALRNATAWWIGDALLFAEQTYGLKAAQIEAARRSPETLRRWAWTCDNVAPRRRNPRLSFTHHEAVAKLDPDEQARWLDKAEGDRLTSDELRAAIAATVEPIRSPANKSESPQPSKPPPGYVSERGVGVIPRGREAVPVEALPDLEQAAIAVVRAASPHTRAGRRSYEVPGEVFETLGRACGQGSLLP